MFHPRTENIAVKHHCVRKVVEKSDIVVEYIPTEKMIADVITKALPAKKHYQCISNIGLDWCTRCLIWRGVLNKTHHTPGSSNIITSRCRRLAGNSQHTHPNLHTVTGIFPRRFLLTISRSYFLAMTKKLPRWMMLKIPWNLPGCF